MIFVFNIMLTTLLLLLAVTHSLAETDYARQLKVFDCFQYHPNNSAAALLHKLKVTSQYVDYFIITEAEAIGKDIPFTFDQRLVAEFANKILYLPIRNVPYRQAKVSKYEE